MRIEDVRHLAEEGARLARRLGRDELEHRRQVVGQLAVGAGQAGLLVGLRRGRSSPGRDRASRRARARTGAARWRGRGRTARRSRPRPPADRRARACPSALRAPPGAGRRGRARRAAASRISGRWPRSSRIGIAEQRGEHAQGLRAPAGALEREHGQTSALMGMVRFFSLPNRLASLVAVGAAVAEARSRSRRAR